MANGPLFVGAEGILLRRHKEHYGSSHPIMEGFELVTALKGFTTRLVIHCYTEDVDTAQFFLKVNGLTQFNVIGLKPVDREEHPAQAQWHALQRQRAIGPISLVLTSFSWVYHNCLGSFQPVSLYGRRGQAGGAEETTITPWSEIEERVKHERAAAVESVPAGGDEF